MMIDVLLLVYVFAWGSCVALMGYFAFARRTIFSREKGALRGRALLARAGNLSAVAAVGNCLINVNQRTWLGAVLSLLLCIASLVLFRSAITVFGKKRPGIAYTSEPPSALVSQGPYSRIRHPIYLAYLLMWGASTVLPWNILGLVIVSVMAILYYRAALFEERLILDSGLGATYRDYQRTTSMIIPGLRALFRR